MSFADIYVQLDSENDSIFFQIKIYNKAMVTIVIFNSLKVNLSQVMQQLNFNL